MPTADFLFTVELFDTMCRMNGSHNRTSTYATQQIGTVEFIDGFWIRYQLAATLQVKYTQHVISLQVVGTPPALVRAREQSALTQGAGDAVRTGDGCDGGGADAGGAGCRSPSSWHTASHGDRRRHSPGLR